MNPQGHFSVLKPFLLQIVIPPLVGIGGKDIFSKKKKMSKHVRNVTKVSHLMRNSERKKLWKSTHFKVGLRI